MDQTPHSPTRVRWQSLFRYLVEAISICIIPAAREACTILPMVGTKMCAEYATAGIKTVSSDVIQLKLQRAFACRGLFKRLCLTNHNKARIVLLSQSLLPRKHAHV